MLSFEEVLRDFDRSHRGYDFVRKHWDSYYILKNNGDEKTSVIYILKRMFPDHKPAYLCKPLGEIKQFTDTDVDYSPEDIYDIFMKRLKVKIHSDYFGEEISMIRVAYRYLRTLAKRKGMKISDTEIVDGFCMMIFNSIKGIVGEKMIIRELGDHLEINAAPDTDESRDIDAYITFNGVEYPVSIKCGRALNENVIHNFRKKGKTEPVIYVGYVYGTIIKALLPVGCNDPDVKDLHKFLNNL